MIGKLQRPRRQLWRGFRHPRRERRRLSRAVFVAQLAGLAASRRGNLALDRDAGARGCDPPFRLSRGSGAGMVSAAADGAGRRRQGRARDPLDARSGRARERDRAVATRRSCSARQGVGGRLAERLVTELKDKAPAFAPIDPLVARLAGAVEAERRLAAARRRCDLGAHQSRLRRNRRPARRSRRRSRRRARIRQPRSSSSSDSGSSHDDRPAPARRANAYPEFDAGFRAAFTISSPGGAM